ncbi:MAG: ribonuclease P protein component [Bacteroidaceae bacterium]|jgi:ribonuclease P protein component|nr:ribonuclease P protein component [Bacteroidaceae bacterium]MBR6990169.1 ribonuclease P protein component [Bacteroidaceae bacterium]
MPDVQSCTFKKPERLCSKIEIDRLFDGGSKSMSAFPIRVVFRLDDAEELNVAVLISVSKKRFHRAVKRNLVKRQIREAYRKNKGVLWDVLKEHSKALSLAFIWLDDEIHESAEVEKKVVNLLLRVKEKLPELL